MGDVRLNTKWLGWDEFEDAMGKAGKNIGPNIHRATVHSLSLVETRAKAVNLAGRILNYHTHRLQRSIKSRAFRKLDTYVGHVGTPVVYGPIHEYGGVILPVASKYLRFQINGKWICTTRVVIPARRWLSRSVEDVYPGIKTAFGKVVDISLPGGD